MKDEQELARRGQPLANPPLPPSCLPGGSHGGRQRLDPRTGCAWRMSPGEHGKRVGRNTACTEDTARSSRLGLPCCLPSGPLSPLPRHGGFQGLQPEVVALPQFGPSGSQWRMHPSSVSKSSQAVRVPPGQERLLDRPVPAAQLWAPVLRPSSRARGPGQPSCALSMQPGRRAGTRPAAPAQARARWWQTPLGAGASWGCGWGTRRREHNLVCGAAQERTELGTTQPARRRVWVWEGSTPVCGCGRPGV